METIEKHVYFCQITYVESKRGLMGTFTYLGDFCTDTITCVKNAVDIAQANINLRQEFSYVSNAAFAVYRINNGDIAKDKPRCWCNFDTIQKAREWLKEQKQK